MLQETEEQRCGLWESEGHESIYGDPACKGRARAGEEIVGLDNQWLKLEDGRDLGMENLG